MNLDAFTAQELELIHEFIDSMMTDKIINEVADLKIESNYQQLSPDPQTTDGLFELCKNNHSKIMTQNQKLGVAQESEDSQYLCRLKQQNLRQSLRKQQQEDTFRKSRQINPND